MQTPGEADKALGKAPQKLPFADYMNGVNLGPVKIGVDGESVGNGGIGLKFKLEKLWKTPNNETP